MNVHWYLETSSLLKEPAILLKLHGVILHLLDSSTKEIDEADAPSSFKEKFHTEKTLGRIVIHPSPTFAIGQRIPAFVVRSSTVEELIRLAERHGRFTPDDRILVVTDDGHLTEKSRTASLAVMKSKLASELMMKQVAGGFNSSRTAKDKIDIHKEAEKVDSIIPTSSTTARTEKKGIAYITGGFISGIIVSALILAVFFNWKTIIDTVGIWGLSVGALIAGFILFSFRYHYLPFYGLVEVIFGCVTALLQNKIVYDATSLAAIAASIYIVVRGLDNIDKGLQAKKALPKPNTKIGEIWNSIVGYDLVGAIVLIILKTIPIIGPFVPQRENKTTP